MADRNASLEGLNRATEMAQQVRALTSLPGDPSSVPDTHIRKAMTDFISAPGDLTHTPQTYTHH